MIVMSCSHPALLLSCDIYVLSRYTILMGSLVFFR